MRNLDAIQAREPKKHGALKWFAFWFAFIGGALGLSAYMVITALQYQFSH